MTRKKRKNLIIAALVLLLATVIATVAVFAYFSVDFDIKNDISTLEKVEVRALITEDGEKETIFRAPGDTYHANLSVTNSSTVTVNDENGKSTTKTVPVSYRIKFGGLVDDPTLKDALIVKIDGKIIGILSKIMDGSGELHLEQDFILTASAQRIHKIELELHAGAGRRFENAVNHITISVAAQTFVNENYIFVRDADEFLQAIYTVNQSTGGKTIYLASDIIFGEAVKTVGIAFEQSVNIDLNGKILTLRAPLVFKRGGALLSSSGDSHVKSNDILGEGNLSESIGKIVVNSTEGYLKIAKNVTVDTFEMQSLNAKALLTDAASLLSRELERGVGAEGISILSDYSAYVLNNILQVSALSDGLLQVVTDKVAKIVTVNSNLNNLPNAIYGALVLTAQGQQISVSIRVNSQKMEKDKLLDAVINENCSFLESARIDNKTEAEQANVTPYIVNRNLYLPDEVGTYAATVQWVSSKISVLGHDGSYIPATADENIYLTAIISYQGERYVREYLLNVKALPADLRLKDICLIQPVTFSSVGEEKLLIDESKYTEYRLQVVGYTLKPEDQAMFHLEQPVNPRDPWKLTLIATPPGDSLRTTITVSAKFELLNQTGVFEEAECEMDVAVKIERKSSIYDEALRYVNGFLSEIVNNTFLSFRLPDSYGSQLAVTYDVPAGSFESNGMQLKNPFDVANYINITRHDTSEHIWWVDILPNSVPRENTQINIKIWMNAPGAPDSEKVERTFSFSLTGIIHFADDDIKDFALYAKLLKATDQSINTGNNDGYITMDEARTANIPTLDLNDTGLSDLKGIEYFLNITELLLSNNQINDISYLSELYNLKILKLANNKITNILPLSDITGLTILDISNNQVVDITDLTRLTRLQELRIDNNGDLTDISAITNMKALGILTAYETKVQGSFDGNGSRNAILTAYFQYLDMANVAPKYYIENISKTFTVSKTDEPEYRAINASINSIKPIYEFANVLYIPPTVNGFNITWESNSEIVKIVKSTNRAYITRPISDVNVSLVARMILPGNVVLSRYFSVLSKGLSTQIQIFIGKHPETNVDIYEFAEKLIPDSTLRYELIKIFNINQEGEDANYITEQEINASSTMSVLLSNKGIKSIEGIQWFPSIQTLDLSNNPFTDVSPLVTLSKNTNCKLDNLFLKYSKVDLSLLKDFEKSLKQLDVYGSPNVNNIEVLKALVAVYDRQPTDGVIHLDSAAVAWNPYKDELSRAATTLTDSVSIKAGGSIELSSSFKWEFFGVEKDISVRYEKQGKHISITNNVVTLSYENAPAMNAYDMIRVVLILNTPKGKTEIALAKLVYVQANFDVMLEVGTDTSGNSVWLPLSEAVPDTNVRKQILNRCILGAENIISRQTFENNMAGAELLFICDTQEGLKGLELFQGMNISKVTVMGLTEDTTKNVPQNEKALSNLNAVAATLTTLELQFCNVDLTAINHAMPNLTSLIISNSVQIKLKNENENVFDQMPNITSFTAYDNSIADFTALTNLQRAKTILIYNNIGSLTKSTDAALNKAFSNYIESASTGADYFYYVRKGEIWYPNSVGVPVINATDAKIGNPVTGAALLIDLHQVNFVVGGTKLYLPLKFASLYDIDWRTAFGVTVSFNKNEISNDAEGNEYFTATINTQTVDAYISIEAYFPDFRKTLTYYIAVEGQSSDTTGFVALNKFYLNISDPFADRKFSDPYFTNLMYQILQKQSPNMTGIYTLEVANTVAEINFANTKTAKNYIISSLKGIENFKGLTSVVINYANITDISPIAELTQLTTLNLDGNNINTLWLDNGDSVFKNLTVLNTLRIAYNKFVEDYSAVVYDNRNNRTVTDITKARLVKLMTLYLEQVDGDTVYGWVTQLRPSQRYNETVEQWFTVNKGATLILNNKQTSSFVQIKGENNVINALNDIKSLNNDSNESKGLQEKYYLFAFGDKFILCPTNQFSSENELTLPLQFKYELVSFQAQNKAWMTFTDTGTIGTINTSLYKVGGEVLILAIASSKLKKQFVIDISNIAGKIGDEIKTPYIEVTGGEKDVYKSFYGLQENQFTPSGSNYLVNAENIIPDYEFRNQMYFVFDTDRNLIIGITEREKSIALTGGTNGFEYKGVRSVLGMELFPNVTNWTFSVTRIDKISAFPQLQYASPAKFTLVIKDEFTSNIEGLLYFKDRITSLTLESFGAFPQSCADVIAKLNVLTNLTLIGTAIYDYSFLLELSDTLQSLDFVAPNSSNNDRNIIYSQNSAFYGNRDKMIQFLFETPGKMTNYSKQEYSGISIVKQNGTLSALDGIALNEDLLSDYLKKTTEVPKPSVNYPLDDSFVAYGKTYGLQYQAIAGQGYTLSGSTITVGDTAAESFQIIVQVVNGEGKPTLKQTLSFTFGVSGSSVSQEIVTEAKFVHTDGVTYDLTTFVPDPALRYNIILAFDSDKDGVITVEEFSKVPPTMTISGTALLADWNPQLPWMMVTSLEGIGILSSYLKVLTFRSMYTLDVSPLQHLLQLERIELNNMSSSTPQNVIATDWACLRQLQNLKTISVDYGSWIRGLEVLSDIVNFNLIEGVTDNHLGNILTASELNAIAYMQAANNFSNTNSKTVLSMRSDQKMASLILSSVDFGTLLKDNSQLYFANQASGSIVDIPSSLNYLGTNYALEYMPLTSNLTFVNNGTEKTKMHILSDVNARNQTASFLIKIVLNGAKYERRIAFDINQAVT